MLISYVRGQTSIVLRIKILNSSVSTGAGLTGLTSASSGLIISTIANNEATATTYTVAGSTIETITTLGTYAAPTATKCRFKEVDATNHPGVYEIQIADARFAVASAKSLLVSVLGATNAAQCDALIPLTDVNPYDAVRGGMTALPNAAAEAAGGLFTRGTGAGQINQAANGMIDTNPVRLNNVSQSLLDLKDFADDGYDPATNKVQGVVLTDTVTTYTGNTPQTGDNFLIVNSGTHGNAALKTLIDDVPTTAEFNARTIASASYALEATSQSILTDTTQLQAGLIGTAGTVSDATPATNGFTTSLTQADNHWTDHILVFTSGALAGQSRIIAIYNNLGGECAFDELWTSAPANGDSFIILSGHAHSKSQIADSIFDELMATHTTVGTFGKAMNDTLADTNELQTDWVNGGRLDLLIDAIKAKTDLLVAFPANFGSIVVTAGGLLKLAADGLDAVLIESSITGSANLTDDAGTQLTSVNARQAIAAIGAGVAGVVAGVATNAPAFKPMGKPSGNTRLAATTAADGRTAVVTKVPT